MHPYREIFKKEGLAMKLYKEKHNRDTGKIGKGFLIQAVGTQYNYKGYEQVISIDKEICESSGCGTCKLKNKIKRTHVANLKDHYKIEKQISTIENHNCKWNCPNEAVTISNKNVYHNEHNKYDISYESKRLSKLQLKQGLLYHFSIINEHGIARGLSLKRIAKILNCSVKTVQSNNIKLMNQGYIWVTYIDSDKFNILLCGYKNYHLEAREGGRGYIQMPNTVLKELLSISNVNALRLEIRKIIEFDNKNIGAKKSSSVSFDNEDIKRLLPKYINYRGAIENVLSQQSSLFVTMYDGKSIKFKLKDSFNSDKFIERTGYKYLDKINKLLEEKKVSIEQEDKQDAIQMCFQYDFASVINSVEQIIDEYILRDKEIRSFGALVRHITRENLGLGSAA